MRVVLVWSERRCVRRHFLSGLVPGSAALTNQSQEVVNKVHEDAAPGLARVYEQNGAALFPTTGLSMEPPHIDRSRQER